MTCPRSKEGAYSFNHRGERIWRVLEIESVHHTREAELKSLRPTLTQCIGVSSGPNLWIWRSVSTALYSFYSYDIFTRNGSNEYI